MTIFNLWIFSPKGSLLFYREWLRRNHTSMERQEEAKLLFGMIYSIRSFVAKLSPDDLKDGFRCYKTSKYRLNMFEAPSGLVFVMNTDTAVTHPIVRDLLHNLYAQVYVEYAVKNPLYELGEPIDSLLFTQKLDELVKSSTFFK